MKKFRICRNGGQNSIHSRFRGDYYNNNDISGSEYGQSYNRGYSNQKNQYGNNIQDNGYCRRGKILQLQYYRINYLGHVAPEYTALSN